MCVETANAGGGAAPAAGGRRDPALLPPIAIVYCDNDRVADCGTITRLAESNFADLATVLRFPHSKFVPQAVLPPPALWLAGPPDSCGTWHVGGDRHAAHLQHHEVAYTAFVHAHFDRCLAWWAWQHGPAPPAKL